MDDTWTIGELAERAVAALNAGGSVQVNGRIRDLPNARLIRWYTTIGLLDPPLGRRGRSALYGPRHLRQLVAVKRRQAEGRSIAEIQLELAAATDAALERIAALPPASSAAPSPPRSRPEAPAPSAHPTTAAPTPPTTPGHSDTTDRPNTSADAPPPTERERARFWSTRPEVSYGPLPISVELDERHPPVIQGVRLAPDVTLLLEVPALSGDDLAAISTATRSLLSELRRRGLAAPADAPAAQPADTPRRSP